MSLRFLKISVSLAVLGMLLWWSDPAAVATQLHGADPTWIIVALASLTLATLSMARRWQLVARCFDITLGYRVALREYYLAQLINTALPGGVAGDVTRAVRLRGTSGLSRAAQSVAAERLLGQLALLGLMGGGFAVALVISGGPHWAWVAWGVLAVLLAAALVVFALARSRTATGRFLRAALGGLRCPEIVVHGIITTLCLILGFYAATRAVGTAIPPSGWATLIPLVLCAMLIPLSVGGWGWRESAAAALFPLVGAQASAGIAAGIAYGVVAFIAVLPGALILITQTYFQLLPVKKKA